ncbi:MAG TPA: type II secretion system protein GspM [Kofleriaceae bacterium]|nr:type II secretion system protein GspM [Kofleriaceae bacterium]
MAATDKLRERWERITPRERMLVMLLGGGLVVVLLAWVWLTISGGLDDLAAKNEQKRDALRQLDRYRRDKAMGLSETSAPKVEIPGQPIELESYLERISKDVGVQIPKYNNQPEGTKGNYTQVSTKVQIQELDIAQLKDLLSRIETGGGGVVIVDELHVKRGFSQGNDKLQATLVVSTFYDKGAAEAPAPPAEKK